MAMAPMMDEMMEPMMAAEEKPAVQAEKALSKKSGDASQESIPKEHISTPCCCCLCVCSNEYTVG